MIKHTPRRTHTFAGVLAVALLSSSVALLGMQAPTGTVLSDFLRGLQGVSNSTMQFFLPNDTKKAAPIIPPAGTEPLRNAASTSVPSATNGTVNVQADIPTSTPCRDAAAKALADERKKIDLMRTRFPLQDPEFFNRFAVEAKMKHDNTIKNCPPTDGTTQPAIVNDAELTQPLIVGTPQPTPINENSNAEPTTMIACIQSAEKVRADALKNIEQNRLEMRASLRQQLPDCTNEIGSTTPTPAR